MTTANITYDPLAAFAIGIPAPGHGSDFAADAVAEIERRYGAEVAQDFAAAYRDHDAEATARVAEKLSGDLTYKISKNADRFVGEAIGEKVNLRLEGSIGTYKSDAHFGLHLGLEMEGRNLALSKEMEEQWKPPVPKFPVKKPRIF